MSVVYCIIYISTLLDAFRGGIKYIERSEYLMIKWALFAIADVHLLHFLREVL